ncbi:hypothetical protein HDE69_003180 [Pedobacter cryoconitis]|uniref:Endosialidase-like protein n=1 Tax=Pedobacter cryoconitis TaxID=188932 RepID=A0A7W8YUN0_9SPHI|nr:hypothetical protein [Pedobacter cryoconitis]MBB5622115.1 hypothetical protein [Pedobacter cryoconitis]
MNKRSILLILLVFCYITVNAQETTTTRDNAGLRGDAGAISGFFQTFNPLNYPSGAREWWHLLDVRHSNPANNYAMQFSGSFFDQNLWFRKTNQNPAQPWLRVVTENEGKVTLGNLNIVGAGASISSDNRSLTEGNFVIRANTGGRTVDKGASLEFALPSAPEGSADWGQARIITVAGNTNNSDATGKMILGTRRMFNKYGKGDQWYYGDDLVVDGIGNIGIGTFSPKEKLSVNGRVRAKEIMVENENWPDYVFEEGYKINTLSELEQYIKINKHLPEIPSAQKVKENGIELGEMNSLLLKKIEELTLHLIDQQKKIDQQGRQIDQLLTK